MFRHLITKERPRHVSSNLMPSKTNNNEPLMTSKSSPDGTQHSELHHGENTACGLLCITYVHLCKDTFGIVLHKVLTSDTQVNFLDPMRVIELKVGGGRFFLRLWYLITIYTRRYQRHTYTVAFHIPSIPTIISFTTGVCRYSYAIIYM